jgi:hypothetical protein
MLGKVYIEDIEALVNEGYPDIPQNEEKFTINGVYEERALDSSYSIIYDALLRDYNNNKIEYTDLCTGLIAILKKTIILEPIFQDAMVWSPEVSHDSNSRIFVQKSRERDKCSVFLVTCGAGENKVTQILDGKYIQDIDLIANNLMKVVYGDEECVVEIKDFDTVLVTGVQFSRGVHDNNVLS